MARYPIGKSLSDQNFRRLAILFLCVLSVIFPSFLLRHSSEISNDFSGVTKVTDCWSFGDDILSTISTPDACAFYGVSMFDGAMGFSIKTTLPKALGNYADFFKESFFFRPVVSENCMIPGSTVLIINYQQHIPHFAEGFFFALSGLLARNGALCVIHEPCNFLFHQMVHWPERKNIYWHQGSMALIMATTSREIKVLNPNLHNVLGSSQSSELLPGCSGGRVIFERLVVLNTRSERRWFSDPRACSFFRRAAWERHTNFSMKSSMIDHRKSGAIALLTRSSRSIVNSKEVSDAMEIRFSMPIRMLSFEGLSFSEQVHMLHDVKLLVAPHGAGLANLVFMPPGAALIEIFPLHWHPIEYFNALARSCDVWYGEYDNFDVSAAVLDETCGALFGGTLPPFQDCSDKNQCIACGKNSSTVVNISRLDAILAQAQYAF